MGILDPKPGTATTRAGMMTLKLRDDKHFDMVDRMTSYYVVFDVTVAVPGDRRDAILAAFDDFKTEHGLR